MLERTKARICARIEHRFHNIKILLRHRKVRYKLARNTARLFSLFAGMKSRKPYPSDVSDEEWSFVVPYLTLVREDGAQRRHDLQEIFNGLRWLIRRVRVSAGEAAQTFAFARRACWR